MAKGEVYGYHGSGAEVKFKVRLTDEDGSAGVVIWVKQGYNGWSVEDIDTGWTMFENRDLWIKIEPDVLSDIYNL